MGKSIYRRLPDRLAHLRPMLSARPWPVIVPPEPKLTSFIHTMEGGCLPVSSRMSFASKKPRAPIPNSVFALADRYISVKENSYEDAD